MDEVYAYRASPETGWWVCVGSTFDEGTDRFHIREEDGVWHAYVGFDWKTHAGISGTFEEVCTICKTLAKLSG